RPQIAGDVRSASAAAAADLQHGLSLQVRGARHVLVELDRAAVGLVAFIETNPDRVRADRRVPIVHEGPARLPVAAGEEVIPGAPEAPLQRRRGGTRPGKDPVPRWGHEATSGGSGGEGDAELDGRGRLVEQ